MSNASQDLDQLRPSDGFASLLSYRLVAWRKDEADVALMIERRHLNRSGVLHGGVLTTLLDVALGYAGCFIATPGRRRRAFTLSLNTQFIATGQVGDRLTAKGHKIGGGASVFFAKGEVLTEGGRLLATAEGVFKYRGESGKPDGEAAD